MSVTNTGKLLSQLNVNHLHNRKKINRLTKVQSISCKTGSHPRFNTSRGLVFLSEFHIDDVKLFKEELRENYNVS